MLDFLVDWRNECSRGQVGSGSSQATRYFVLIVATSFTGNLRFDGHQTIIANCSAVRMGIAHGMDNHAPSVQ
jgi:hypothetical protein